MLVRDSKLFRPSVKLLDYQTEWNSRFRLNKGQFSGVAYFQDATGSSDPASRLFQTYHPTGSLYFGGDSTLETMALKASQEFDENKRRTLVYDIQRYVAGKMFSPRVGGASSYTLLWEAVRNKFVWQTGGALVDFHTVWLDPAKKPLS
jgi:hypothetical protein